ncbi:hypothetical protein [Allorhizobium undicola]|uniref:hypothetical protein n=1 Tax=Allorhizobium undicola TaxID=78527 RepID=UPI0012B5C7D4|nr:hypothetical protein [Allorhizobium undicola]
MSVSQNRCTLLRDMLLFCRMSVSQNHCTLLPDMLRDLCQQRSKPAASDAEGFKGSLLSFGFIENTKKSQRSAILESASQQHGTQEFNDCHG